MHPWLARLALLVVPCAALATEPPCTAVTPAAETRITATCAGKTSCAMDDLLDIKIPPEVDALTRIDLRMPCLPVQHASTADTGSATPTPPISVNLATEVSQGVLNVAIGRLIEARLPPSNGPDAARLVQLLGDPNWIQGMPVQIDFVPKTGKTTTHALKLDISKLWTSGKLKPVLRQATCAGDRGCRFGDLLTLNLDYYATWAAFAKPDVSKLQLVLAGERIPGLATAALANHNGLSFRLARDAAKPDQVLAWATVLNAVDHGEGKVKAGLAHDQGLIAASDGQLKMTQFGLVDRAWWTMVPAFVVFIFAIALHDASNRHHWLWLRDGAPISNDDEMAQTMPFSLGRCQMFAWTLVILFSLAFIGFSTGDWNSFNGTALVLMGLGAGTVLGSVAAGLPAETNKLTEDYRKALADTTKTAADKAALRQALMKAVGTKSVWSDLTGSEDANRTGLHRLQSLVFTFVLICLFLFMVVSSRTMPDLTTTQLALLGISSGAYLGFKAAGK